MQICKSEKKWRMAIPSCDMFGNASYIAFLHIKVLTTFTFIHMPDSYRVFFYTDGPPLKS